MTVFHKGRKGGRRDRCVTERHLVPSQFLQSHIVKGVAPKPKNVHGANINAVLILVSPQRSVSAPIRRATPLMRLAAGREFPVYTICCLCTQFLRISKHEDSKSTGNINNPTMPQSQVFIHKMYDDALKQSNTKF